LPQSRLLILTVTMGRVVVTHWVHPKVRDYLEEFCEALIPSRAEGVWPRERVARLAADADGLIACMADTVDEAFLADCPRLRVISATLKGYDNFDADACARHGTWLTIDWLLPGHPAAIPPRLLRHPRTLFTPHLGSAVDDVRRRMSMQAARQALEGKRPDNAGDEELGLVVDGVLLDTCVLLESYLCDTLLMRIQGRRQPVQIAANQRTPGLQAALLGAGGAWLCRTCLPSGLRASVVPSGWRVSCQPFR
jgi:hypothetical protein